MRRFMYSELSFINRTLSDLKSFSVATPHLEKLLVRVSPMFWRRGRPLPSNSQILSRGIET